MKRLFHATGLLLAIVAAVFFVTQILRYRNLFVAHRWDAAAIGYFVLALGLYISVLAVAAFVWQRILLDVGGQVGYARALTIFWTSQFGKYIPGNVAQHLSRLNLARRYGLQPSIVIFSTAIETASVILAACAVSLSVLTRSESPLGPGPSDGPSTTLLILLAIGSALTPLVFGYLLKKPFAGSLRKWTGDVQVGMPSTRTLLVSFLLNVGNFGILGIMLFATGQAIHSEAQPSVWNLAAVFSLAWVAGFVTPGAPAGVGIREVLLTAGLSPIYGAPQAVVLTVVQRLATSIGDCAVWMVGLALHRRFSQAGAPLCRTDYKVPNETL